MSRSNCSVIFILSFLFSFSTKISAQSFKGGLMVGPTITDVNGADLIDNDNDFHKLGFSAGGLVSLKINPKSNFLMELAYIKKGSLQPPDSTLSNNYYTMALNYIDVSFIFRHQIKLNFKKKEITRFGYEAGVTTGKAIKSYYDFRGQTQIMDINKFDLNLLAGIYYNFVSNFYLNLRYSNSIVHAIKHNSSNNFYPYRTWNKGNNLVFQITLSYIFNSSKEESSDQ